MLLRTFRLFSALALVTGFFVPTPLLAAGDSGQRDPRIEKILSQISEQRLTEILQKLGSFGTRNTLSQTGSSGRRAVSRRAAGGQPRARRE